MGNYTIFQIFENPWTGREAGNFNKASENSGSQIVFRKDIFRKLTLSALDRMQLRGNVLRYVKVTRKAKLSPKGH